MSLENVAGNPADDSGDSRASLREQLEQAFASAETGKPDTPASEPSAEPVSAIEAEPNSERQSGPDVRPRGPDGKFTEKPKAEAAPAKAAPAAQNTPAQPGQSAKRQAPQSWAADKRAIFDTLAPDVQDYLLQRESEQIAGVQKLKGDYEGKLSSLAPVAESLKQVEQRLRLNGVEPARYVSQLIAADEYLRTKPQEAIRWIAQSYGIDLGAIGAQPQGQAPSQDPLAPVIQQYVAPLYQEIQAFKTAQQQAEAAQLQSRIDAFKADPKHEHFETVRKEMGALIQAGLAKDLDDAYDMAIHANPQIRAKVLADQQARAEAEKRSQAQAQVSRAKAAAVSVTGSPGVAVSNAASKPKSLRAELESQFADRI